MMVRSDMACLSVDTGLEDLSDVLPDPNSKVADAVFKFPAPKQPVATRICNATADITGKLDDIVLSRINLIWPLLVEHSALAAFYNVTIEDAQKLTVEPPKPGSVVDMLREMHQTMLQMQGEIYNLQAANRYLEARLAASEDVVNALHDKAIQDMMEDKAVADALSVMGDDGGTLF